MPEDPMTTERIEEILGAVPIFARLEERDVRKLAKLCVPKTFAPGDTVIEEGGMGLGMFVITSGRVDVFKEGDSGQVPLGGMEEGEVLGEIALIDDQPRSATAIAVTETECLLLTRDSFETLVKKEPDVAWCIVPVLAERIRELHERAVEAEGRLSSAAPQPAGAATPEAEVEVPKASEASGDDEEDESSDVQEAVAKMFRMQYGLMLGGMTGVTGMARLWEGFFRKLADENEIADTDELGDLMEKAPDSFVAAGRKALTDLEDLPQEMVDSFRSVFKDD